MNLIEFDKKNKIFHLKNKYISYVFQVKRGHLIQKYYGKRISAYSGGRDYPLKTRGSFAPNFPGDENNDYSLASLLQEFPGANQGDYRSAAFEVTYSDGSNNSQCHYVDYEIVKGVMPIPDMPYCHGGLVEAETLKILLEDKISHLKIYLYYTIYENYPIIVRKTKIENHSNKIIKINNIKSMSLDFAESDFDLIQLPGTWGRERQVVREKVNFGIKKLGSIRGTSSHNQNPFLILCDPNTTEDIGRAISVSLIYSGNHEMIIQKDSYTQLRVQSGINSEMFEWELASGDSFYTPEAIINYSEAGLTALSQSLHQFVNNHLIQSSYKNKIRPILLNNWEATYMEFTEEQIVSLMETSSQLGIECFVLDDGWFGSRNDDTSSLGDWIVNKNKLPKGLKFLTDKANKLGLMFGLWFEPEMVSPKSNLYQIHPDWVLHNQSKGVSLARNQLILDLGRKDVQEYLFQSVSNILDSANIKYVKWDMNRNFSETYSNVLPAHQQKSASHRYVLGLYNLLDRLTTKYPDVLFESCSGGGGRYDLGMLYYMPQTWTSDNTDAIERLKIQYGTSMAYPISSMAAHVSASPNHQNGRITSLRTRGNVAMSGLLGYELNVLKLSERDKEIITEQIKKYKEIRDLVQYGTYYRLKSPFEGNEAAWIFVSDNQEKAVVTYTQVLSAASPSLNILRLAGLDPKGQYVDDSGSVMYGDELMNMGYYIQNKRHQHPYGDFESTLVVLRKVEGGQYG